MADLTARGVTVGVPKQATLQPATWLSVFPLPVYFEVISVGVFPSVGEGREGRGAHLEQDFPDRRHLGKAGWGKAAPGLGSGTACETQREPNWRREL